MRESLRDSLARIPDLDPSEPAEAFVAAGVAASASASSPAGGGGPEAVASGTATALADPPEGPPADGPVAFEDQLRAVLSSQDPVPVEGAGVEEPVDPAPTAAIDGAGPGDPVGPVVFVRRKPPMWRRVLFGLVLVGLIASIPVLVGYGWKLIEDSKGGQFNTQELRPTDPNYEAQVDPTPTAVAIQYDDQGLPNGVTFMALGGADGGGSVVFVPLDTKVTEPSYGVDTLRRSYEVVADRPALARQRLASQVGRLLNVSVDEIIDLGNAGWAQLTEPVGPLTIDNPDQVDLGFGQVIPTGETTLNADQVGRYLATSLPGESDLNRLNRHQEVWSAWLEQVAAADTEDAVPGESAAGIGRFARALAAGPVAYDTLPVGVDPEDPGRFITDEQAVNELITNTVPSPAPAVPGSRFTVRLLNGVSADAIPSDVVRDIVGRGGAVTILGNGPQFDTDETTIVYANPKKKDLATLIATSLGATGKVRLDREAPDTVDLTIVLGKDILGDASGTGTPGATTTDPATGGD